MGSGCDPRGEDLGFAPRGRRNQPFVSTQVVSTQDKSSSIVILRELGEL